jgi:hypothetical protein
MVSPRNFHLAHRDLSISVGSWVAVEANAMGSLDWAGYKNTYKDYSLS